jgi:hypothetical protein
LLRGLRLGTKRKAFCENIAFSCDPLGPWYSKNQYCGGGINNTTEQRDG